MTKYDYDFDPDQPNNTAAAIYRAARAGGPRVLDVGSGPGIVAGALSALEGREVTCLDYDADALELARGRGVAGTHVVDLRDPEWYACVAGRSFDVVLLADVLEHLVDPERVLGDLQYQRLLAPGAQLVVSIPNANHQAVVAELLTGHFRYTETGLLDSTHLRFFTLDSMRALLEGNGFHLTRLHRTLRRLEDTPYAYRGAELPDAVREAIGHLGEEGRTYQYVLTARVSDEAARLSELDDLLDAARREAEDLRRRARVLEKRLADTAALLAEERTERDVAWRSGAMELEELRESAERSRQQVEKERARADQAERRLKDLRGSRTYRAGRVVAQPLTVARSRLRARGRS